MTSVGRSTHCTKREKYLTTALPRLDIVPKTLLSSMGYDMKVRHRTFCSVPPDPFMHGDIVAILPPDGIRHVSSYDPLSSKAQSFGAFSHVVISQLVSLYSDIQNSR